MASLVCQGCDEVMVEFAEIMQPVSSSPFLKEGPIKGLDHLHAIGLAVMVLCLVDCSPLYSLQYLDVSGAVRIS